MGLELSIRALWHELRGEWDEAHATVQALDGADAAWAHTWLHRTEGDFGNAAYSHRWAGRRAAKGATGSEGRAVAAALLGG